MKPSARSIEFFLKSFGRKAMCALYPVLWFFNVIFPTFSIHILPNIKLLTRVLMFSTDQVYTSFILVRMMLKLPLFAISIACPLNLNVGAIHPLKMIFGASA